MKWKFKFISTIALAYTIWAGFRLSLSFPQSYSSWTDSKIVKIRNYYLYLLKFTPFSENKVQIICSSKFRLFYETIQHFEGENIRFLIGLKLDYNSSKRWMNLIFPPRKVGGQLDRSVFASVSAGEQGEENVWKIKQLLHSNTSLGAPHSKYAPQMFPIQIEIQKILFIASELRGMVEFNFIQKHKKIWKNTHSYDLPIIHPSPLRSLWVRIGDGRISEWTEHRDGDWIDLTREIISKMKIRIRVGIVAKDYPKINLSSRLRYFPISFPSVLFSGRLRCCVLCCGNGTWCRSADIPHIIFITPHKTNK